MQFRIQQLWKDRLELGLSVDGANFYRNQGYAGQRLDFAPSVALPFHLGKYVCGSVKAIGRETLYLMTSEDVGSPILPESGRLRGDRTRETVQFQTELCTRLSRVFKLQWGRLRQVHM